MGGRPTGCRKAPSPAGRNLIKSFCTVWHNNKLPPLRSSALLNNRRLRYCSISTNRWRKRQFRGRSAGDGRSPCGLWWEFLATIEAAYAIIYGFITGSYRKDTTNMSKIKIWVGFLLPHFHTSTRKKRVEVLFLQKKHFTRKTKILRERGH